MAKINEGIFRTYDIRGIYPDEINDEAAYLVAKGFAAFSRAKKIPVAYDMRGSSTAILKSVIEGLKKSGVEAINIGMMPTPVLNFAVSKKNFKAGMIITASHNPSEFNGIKLIGPKAVQYMTDTGLNKVKEIITDNNFLSGRGKVKKENYLPLYLQKIKKHAAGIKKLKIVVDFGNGLGAITAIPLYQTLPIETFYLYEKPDGSYPNHEANPAEEKNLADLKKELKKRKADLGIAFDGDADRAIFIDEKGETVRADHLTAALVPYQLKNKTRKEVYYDLRFSKIVPQIIKKCGGIPKISKVGNPYYKERLILEGGAFAVENTGHMMFADFYGIDDGLFATLKIMELLSLENKKLSAIVKPFKENYFQSGEINIESQNAEQAINEIKKSYSRGKFSTLDGLTVGFNDFWFNLRASNTEPVIRLNIEAKSKELLQQKTDEVVDLIKKNL